MAKPKQLPSGNWRIQVFSHMEGNKKIYKSFTDPDKKKVIKMAHEFQDNRTEGFEKELTIEKAMDDYISSRVGVASPSTIRGYRQMQRNYYNSVNSIYVSRITEKDLQYFVSELARTHSPKSIKNIYSLLASVIGMHSDKKYKVLLPEVQDIDYATPDDAEVKILLDNASDKMKLCIYLSAIGTLRRGEISALKYADILTDLGAIYIHSDIVMDEHNKWQYKPNPKNKSSVRTVPLPKSIMELIGTGDPDDYIIGWSPNRITDNFIRLRNKCGLQCRFHDLRHYAATIRMYMGIPMKEIQILGGWSNPGTLQKIYTNQLKSKSIEYIKKTNAYFEENLIEENKKAE